MLHAALERSRVSPLLLLPLLLASPEMGAVKRVSHEVKAATAPQLPPTADLKTGDLIFHTSTSNQAVAIAVATSSPLTHVGMIRVHNGKAFVIEASARVQVVTLQAFAERGRLGRFLILRDPTLTSAERGRMWRAAKALKGRPYDLFFTYDRARVYCSELVWRAYEAVHKEPAADEAVADLFVDNAAVDALMKKRWRRHPACRRAKAKSLASCWERAKQERIITPAKIADDGRYEVIASNYPPPWR